MQQIQNIPKLQNMNYAIYTYYKNEIFLKKEILKKNTHLKYFGMFGLFCTTNRHFEYRIKILCI